MGTVGKDLGYPTERFAGDGQHLKAHYREVVEFAFTERWQVIFGDIQHLAAHRLGRFYSLDSFQHHPQSSGPGRRNLKHAHRTRHRALLADKTALQMTEVAVGIVKPDSQRSAQPMTTNHPPPSHELRRSPGTGRRRRRANLAPPPPGLGARLARAIFLQ